MTERKIAWTKEQEQALTAGNVSLAVSAAAGSGKTAVLTERIVRLLSAPAPHALDVSKLCVVTFTKAAAGDLESKLYEALTCAVAEHPEDKNLSRQLFRLDQAHISTIDSFCLDLIRAYRRELDLRPGVRVCDETEEALLFREAQEEGLDAFLAAPGNGTEKEDFYALFCTAKSREGLLAVLREMKQKADNDADGAQFFRARLDALAREVREVSAGKITFYESRPGKLLTENALAILDRVAEETAYLAEDIARSRPNLAEKRCDFFMARREALREARAVLAGGEVFRAGQMLEAAYGASLPAIRGLSEEEKAEKAVYDGAWNRFKKELKTLAETDLSTPWQDHQADLEAFLPLAFSLVELFETVLARFGEKKRERNVLSFADLAALTLKLVGEKREDGFVPTETGREIGKRFQAVFVDEYQDTNSIQDAIFRCITGGRNLFLVGDPKQCVYHFRGAQPEVFIRYRRTLPDYDPAGDQDMARHFLSHNFRCDRPIIDLTNKLFRVLMDAPSPDSLYKKEDELYPGRSGGYRDLPAELCVLEPKPKQEESSAARVQQEEEEDAENREAAWIARRIRSILSGEITRSDGSRYAPEDIAVIARTWKNVEKVQAALRRRGIPSAWSKGAEAESVPEEYFVTSLLRAADNPTRDVPLLAALYSPVFRFSPDDLFRLRKGHPGVSFYAALCAEAAGEGSAAPACRNALDALNLVRRGARSMTPTELVFLIYRTFSVEELYRKTSPGDGAVRRKFLRLARAAEDAGFTSLERFCLYLASAKEKNDGGAGETGVKLMTIHKAKGLEFPVVFVSFLAAGKKGNKDGRVWMTRDFGAAFPLPKWGGVSYRDHLLTALARREEAREEREEELRVLYVALTRARDKLIITGAPAGFSALRSRTLSDCAAPFSPSLAQSLLRVAANPLEFLLIGLHDSPALRDALAVGKGAEPGFTASLVPFDADPGDAAEEAAPEAEEENTAGTAPLPPWTAIRPYLDFTYAHPEREVLPKKLSVSEIVRRGEEGEAQLIPRALTDFERGVLKADAAFKGTAIHQAMQYADLTAAARDPEGEIERLLREGFITEKMAREIDRAHFAAFFGSDLYRRIAASPRVVHEKRFNVLLPGEELVGRTGEILIQGVVDLWFEKEDGTLAILDFKTDRLPPDGDAVLAERHGEQLRIYRRAVEAIEEKQVTELLLYSFSLDRAVPVSL
ncbi:MAG: UvrD-helicase domain-containing protein [Clostridia bacterium]|nr:UvrD-helicase domain-containing protein [Clostridia bacterium]